MCDFIHLLPRDIIQHIIPYTYSCQTPQLIEDIKSNFASKQIISTIYDDRWNYLSQYEENISKNWLNNDLFRYCNEDNITMHGYIDRFYGLFSRHVMLQSGAINKCKVNAFIKNTDNNVTQQINLIWGLLTPRERSEFIANYCVR
jgi:hypothetical protein